MVPVATADGDLRVVDGRAVDARVVALDAPDLGVEPGLDVLGAPVAAYGD